MDSLKRHIAENHKGVRPFACSLCDKTYGRRDYLQRHLKSHNANYAVNLQSASNISASQVVQKVQVHQPHHSINHHSPSKNTIILQQGQGGTLQVVSSNSAANSSATQSGSGGSRYVHLYKLSIANAIYFEDKTIYLHTPTLHQFLHKNATLFVRCSNNSLYVHINDSSNHQLLNLNSANILSKTLVSFFQKKNLQFIAIFLVLM